MWLQAAHDDVQTHRALFEKFEGANELDTQALVAGHWDEITPGFLDFCKDNMNAAMADSSVPEEQRAARRKELSGVTAGIMAMAQAMESAMSDETKIAEAAKNFQSLLQVRTNTWCWR